MTTHNPAFTAAAPLQGILSATGEKAASNLGQVSWALYECSRSPYLSLVTIYVFAPYFTNTVIGDPIRGQGMWSLANTIAGFMVAILAPMTGAMSDRMGRRKPWIFAIMAYMVPACIVLWWAMPGGVGGLPVGFILAMIAVLAMGFSCGEVFHNSMLPSIVSAQRLGSLSGLGLAVGNAGSLVALTGVLFFIALPASDYIDWGFLPMRPVCLDSGLHEHERIAGPIAACGLLFTCRCCCGRLIAHTGISVRRRGRGVAQLWHTIKRARQVPTWGCILLARMLYTDGLVATGRLRGHLYPAFAWDVASVDACSGGADAGRYRRGVAEADRRQDRLQTRHPVRCGRCRPVDDRGDFDHSDTDFLLLSLRCCRGPLWYSPTSRLCRSSCISSSSSSWWCSSAPFSPTAAP
jgi:UMF1 family MFS transporter